MLIKFIIAITCAEILLFSLVRLLRRHFQWLIIPADKAPKIPTDKVAKHAKQSFHPELGWLHKPNASWMNSTTLGDVFYHTDHLGRRHNPGYDSLPMHIAVYGDSYAFCRLVPDNCTWPHYMSKMLDFHVGNFGVGNYGIDQALLRYEMDSSINPNIVIMAIVPETIVRIKSYWKHYFEYGNLLAFKPRFFLQGDKLEIIPSPIKSCEDFSNYTKKINSIQKIDGFYYNKFIKDIICFPYLISVFRRPYRHFSIIMYLLTGFVKKNFKSGWRKAFKLILDENAKWTKKLYNNEDSCLLLEAIVKRFAKTCRERGAFPVLVVIPQHTDLANRTQEAYGSFFSSLVKHLKVIDLTKIFEKYKNIDSLFISGDLGPHTSKEANKLIADELIKHIKF